MSNSTSSANGNGIRRFLVIFSLVFAGESIFSLPFHITRFFRPTVLEVLDLSNTQLGDMFAAYGIIAMLAYFPGGILADRFSARNLMTASLLATSFGGIIMAQLPAPMIMSLVYGWWGLTTVFLFWAAMIKATREWGGELAQGSAFGILDGGRGLIAALSASAAVVVFGLFLPEGIESSALSDRSAGLSGIIWFYTGITATAALLVWICIPNNEPAKSESSPAFIEGLTQVLSRPLVWAQGGVIVCAYCCYKALDNYGLYATQVLGMNQYESADFIAQTAYLRFVGAVAAGFIADKLTARNSIRFCFASLIFAYVGLTQWTPDRVAQGLMIGNLVLTYLLVYGIRGIYFSLLGEIRTPAHLTGTTAGVVSVLGFTPDIFFYPLAGRILDAAPGVEGHLNYFTLLAGVAALGLVISALLIVLNKKDLLRDSS